MQQIISYIIKNSHRMLFLLLMIFAIWLTIDSHSYHKSKVISSANFFTGGIYAEVNAINEYLDLKTKNEELAFENARLKSLLINIQDTTKTIAIDSIKGVKKTDLVIAKVIKNSYSVHENFLTIDAGEKQGIAPDMGVINSAGIVGITETISSKYATVISILNTKSQINAKIKKSNHFGTLIWNAKSTGFVQLIDVPRLASVRKGDTVVTGSQSTIFPENINIGTIDKIYIDNETNFFTINVKLFNDMTSLGHVYIIKNKDKKEIEELEKTIKKDE